MENNIAATVFLLRGLLAKAKLPWLYRPDKYDDWGFIRGPEEEMSFGIARPVVAIARGLDGDETFAQHRSDKTDPYEPYGQLIVAAVNALPDLLDQLEAKAASVQEALEQYRNDMLYPPAPDSRGRRIEMIDAALRSFAAPSEGVS